MTLPAEKKVCADTRLHTFPYPQRLLSEDSSARNPNLGATEAAALRQFSLPRLLAYGVELGDATRLMESVAEGASWERCAIDMCGQLTSRRTQAHLDSALSPALEEEFLERESALLRISQAMIVGNTESRRRIYLESARLFAQAKALNSRYSPHTITSSEGLMHAWEIRPDTSNPRGIVLVHGGVDGWSMDWDALGRQFADEGYITLVLDGPGQGISRFVHETYLGPNWLQAYEAVINKMHEIAPSLPLFAVGNSMAAGMVLQIQSRYEAFDAVCSNGPVKEMSKLFERKTYAKKLASFCGWSMDPTEAQKVFESVDVTPQRVVQTSPVLLLQGDEDPMVSMDDGREILEWTESESAQFAVFERGEHVINRFPADKHMLIRTWLNILSPPYMLSVHDSSGSTQKTVNKLQKARA